MPSSTMLSSDLRTPLRTEFAIDMHCSSCEQTVRSALAPLSGVTSVTVSLPQKTVVVESTTPPSRILQALRATQLGPVVLKGQSSASSSATPHLGAAVCIFESFAGAKGWAQHNNRGLARLVQVDADTCLVDVTVQGVEPGEHTVSVHECGDISGGCESTGQAMTLLGRVLVDAAGRGDLVVEKRDVKVWDIIGRSIVVNAEKAVGTSAGPVCGIIARSAGVFQNPKSVCSCDGKTLWEESTESAAPAPSL
ncbi:hypothetical protein HKX48_000670 [Thoreauomyces humboldtii]|nr:hypothetical protein HKX48_000670 [Thoreauomyces humboldtii]